MGRKQNEEMLACYTVTVYAPSSRIHDPSGAGTDSEAVFQQAQETLNESLNDLIPETVQQQFPEWGNDLRVEIQPIT